MKNCKNDNPRDGSKYLSDATCGAVFNAVFYAEKPNDFEVEVLTLKDVRARMQQDQEPHPQGVIVPPKSNRPPPEDISEWLSQMKVL
jgi:hypothetical protein